MIEFFRSHLTISLTVLLLSLTAIIIILFKNIIKRRLGRSITLLLFLIYGYMSFITGSWIFLENISSLKLFREFKKSDISYTSRIKFPLWKAFKLRFWHDLALPVNKRPFPSLHYLVEADFYYDNILNEHSDKKKAVHDSKSWVCVIKNLGQKSLKIEGIKNIIFKRNKAVISTDEYQRAFLVIDMENNKTELRTIKGLINLLNGEYANKPIILYPKQEKELFNISIACTYELLSLEIDIECADFPTRKETFIYYQVDEVKFSDIAPEALPAKTIDYGFR